MALTFLSAVQRLWEESGATGIAPASVLNQTNQNAQLVSWVREAWVRIQAERRWRFMRSSIDFVTIANQQDYTFTALGLGNFSEVDDKHIVVTDSNGGKQYLRFFPFESYLDRFGISATQKTAPQFLTITPDLSSFRFFPIPDAVYTITAPYWKQPTRLAASADLFPMLDEDVETIVWRAMMMYCDHNDIPSLRAVTRVKYNTALNAMMRRHLPRPSILSEPLA